MKKLLIILAIGCTYFAPSIALAQQSLDEENINKANATLTKNHNCKEAIMYLNFVSDSGKTTAPYILGMAKAYDCYSDKNKSIDYYNHYLAINPNDETAKKRLAEIKAGKSEVTEVSKEAVQAKEIYNYVKTGKNEENKKMFSKKYFVCGLSIDNFIGGDRAAFRHSYNFFNSEGIAFAKQHLVFEFNGQIGYITNSNNKWFGAIFNVPASAIEKSPSTISVDIELGISAIVYNEPKMGISLGPTIGFYTFFMPGLYFNIPMSNIYSSQLYFSPGVGLKANMLLNKHFYFSLEYLMLKTTDYENTESNLNTITPTNMSSIRLAVGVRGYGTPSGSITRPPSSFYH